MRPTYITSSLFMVLATTGTVQSQPATNPDRVESPTATSESEQRALDNTERSTDSDQENSRSAVPAEKQDTEALENQVISMKKEMASMKEEMASTKEEMASMKEEYTAKFEEAELADFEEESETEEVKLHISGFFDTSFLKKWPRSKTLLDTMIIDAPVFIMQNFNVLMSNRMSEQFSFLGELRFTFLPNGSGDAFLIDSEREDTTVTMPPTQESFKLGGVAIERVYLKWMKWDFFGVMVGYYLTPYGIWQLDHGSPVRLSILHPLNINTLVPVSFQNNSILPNAQLGLQALGRFFLLDDLFLDYAVTLSNGRGPADTVVDYDNNKGVGLKIKLIYKKPDFDASLGGYGYYSTYSDKVIDGLNYDPVQEHREYTFSIDGLIAYKGLRLQGEYIRSLILYSDSVPRPMTPPFNLISPDHTNVKAYVMLAYELPLDDLLGTMRLTPYASIAFERPYSGKWYNTNSYWAGLNFKPSAWVTLKTEVVYNEVSLEVVPGQLDTTNPAMWSWNSQVAVSF